MNASFVIIAPSMGSLLVELYIRLNLFSRNSNKLNIKPICKFSLTCREWLLIIQKDDKNKNKNKKKQTNKQTKIPAYISQMKSPFHNKAVKLNANHYLQNLPQKAILNILRKKVTSDNHIRQTGSGQTFSPRPLLLIVFTEHLKNCSQRWCVFQDTTCTKSLGDLVKNHNSVIQRVSAYLSKWILLQHRRSYRFVICQYTA